jgi:hypothetical protein
MAPIATRNRSAVGDSPLSFLPLLRSEFLKPVKFLGKSEKIGGVGATALRGVTIRVSVIVVVGIGPLEGRDAHGNGLPVGSSRPFWRWLEVSDDALGMAAVGDVVIVVVSIDIEGKGVCL